MLFLRKFIIIFLVLAYLYPQPASAAVWVRVEAPEYSQSVLYSTDLLHLGRDQLLIGRDSALEIRLADELLFHLTGIPGTITAIAAGDLTGNFRSEIVVGTDNAGAFYFYEFRNQTWQRMGQPRYLWAPIEELRVADITGNGWGDIVAVNRRGEAEIFLSWEGDLHRFWRSEPGDRIRFVLTADLDGDGQDEVIFVRDSAYLGILKWHNTELGLVFENYPWGQIQSLLLVPNKEPHRPEIVITTDQQMLYSWQWQHDRLALTRSFHAPRLGEQFYYSPTHGLISLSREEGAVLLQLQDQELRRLESVPGIFGLDVLQHEQALLVQTAGSEYFWLKQVETDYLRAYRSGVPFDVMPEAHITEDKLLIDLIHTAKELGLEVYGTSIHNPESGVVIAVTPGKPTAALGSLAIPLPGEPVIRSEERLLVNPNFFHLFGWESEFDPVRRELHFRPAWGWWLDPTAPSSAYY